MHNIKISKSKLKSDSSDVNSLGKELGAVLTNNEDTYPSIGEWKIELPVVDRGKCIGCSSCSKNCPEGTIEMSKNSKKRPIVHYDFCKGCGVCSVVCPVEAISMIQRDRKDN